MKTVLQGLAGLVLAGLLLAWVLHDKDPKALAEALGHASWGLLVAGALLNFGHNLFRVRRWGILLEPVRRGVPFRPMFTAVVIGYFTTWIVPGRLGELVRPLLLAGRERLPLGPCLGSVVSDRLLDGAAIVVLFAVGGAVAPLGGDALAHTAQIRGTAYLLVGVLAAGLGILLAASAAAPRIESLLARRGALLRRGGRAFLELARGTEALRSPSAFVRAAALSLAAWVTIAAGTWLGIRAAGAEVPFSASLVLLPLLALGVALPTPGGAGGYHAAMAWGLGTLFGVPPAIAVGAGILMHLAIVIPVLVAGPVLLKVDGLAWGDVVAAMKSARGLGAAPAAGAGAEGTP